MTQRTSNSRKIFTPLALSATFLAAWSSTVVAENCLDQVRSLAAEYRLAIDPPDAGELGSEMNQSANGLSRSRGVIEPEGTGGSLVIDPPKTGDRQILALPSVPQDGGRRDADADDQMTGAELDIASALLTSARADAQRGDEIGCLERLKEAHAAIALSR